MRAVRSSVWEYALKITGGFEGSGYDNITGNFDGQGLSLGFLQWNFGQGTLQPLFSKLFDRHSDVAKETLGEGAEELSEAIKSNRAKDYAAQKMNSGQKVVEPWLSRLKELCNTPEFRGIQDEFMAKYRNNAIAMCEKFGIYTDRAFCLFFDIAVQNGSVVHPPQVAGMGDIDKMKTIINAVVAQSNQSFQNDVRSRKECILKSQGYVHGGTFRFPFIKDEDAFCGELEYSLNLLKDKGVINSSDYWLENAVERKEVKGDYMKVVILKFVAMYKNLDTFKECVEELVTMGIINSPDYWIENAVENGSVNGSYAATLMSRMEMEIRG